MVQIIARLDFSSSKKSCMEHGICNAFASRYFVFELGILVSRTTPDHHQPISPKADSFPVHCAGGSKFLASTPTPASVLLCELNAAQLGSHLVTCSFTLHKLLLQHRRRSRSFCSEHVFCNAFNKLYFVLQLMILESGPTLKSHWHISPGCERTGHPKFFCRHTPQLQFCSATSTRPTGIPCPFTLHQLLPQHRDRCNQFTHLIFH